MERALAHVEPWMTWPSHDAVDAVDAGGYPTCVCGNWGEVPVTRWVEPGVAEPDMESCPICGDLVYALCVARTGRM